MLSLKEAYDIFKQKHPETISKTICDFGKYYFIDGATTIEGDFSSDGYKIDKNTGDIEELDFIEYSKDVPEEDFETYTEY